MTSAARVTASFQTAGFAGAAIQSAAPAPPPSTAVTDTAPVRIPPPQAAQLTPGEVFVAPELLPARRPRERLRGAQRARIGGELLDALHGRRAFRRFKDALQRLELAEEWYRYREGALEEIAVEFLEANGIGYRREAKQQ